MNLMNAFYYHTLNLVYIIIRIFGVIIQSREQLF